MALFEVLSGKSMYLYIPDVFWQGDLATKGTITLTVTQKPKFIVWGIIRATGTTVESHAGGVLIVDCTAEKLKRIWYSNPNYVVEDNPSGNSFAERVPVCTSSKITIRGGSTYKTHNHVLIYY